MNPLAIPLPLAVRRHGEIVGIIFGIVCFPFALYAGSLSTVFPNGPTALMVPIVMLSAFAGAVASLSVNVNNAPDIGGVPLRVGARAGVIASLVGGGCTVLASTFHSFGVGSPPSGGTGWNFLHAFVPSCPSIALALLALPPSVFFGLTGALVAEMLKGSAASADGGTPSPANARIARSASFWFALTLTIACYLSPLISLSSPRRSPRPSSPLRPHPLLRQLLCRNRRRLLHHRGAIKSPMDLTPLRLDAFSPPTGASFLKSRKELPLQFLPTVSTLLAAGVASECKFKLSNWNRSM